MSVLNSSFVGSILTLTPEVPSGVDVPISLASSYTIEMWADDKEPIAISQNGALRESIVTANGTVKTWSNNVSYNLVISVLAGSEDERFLQLVYAEAKNRKWGQPLNFTIGIRKPDNTTISLTNAHLIDGEVFAGASNTVYNSSSWTFFAEDIIVLS